MGEGSSSSGAAGILSVEGADSAPSGMGEQGPATAAVAAAMSANSLLSGHADSVEAAAEAAATAMREAGAPSLTVVLAASEDLQHVHLQLQLAPAAAPACMHAGSHVQEPDQAPAVQHAATADVGSTSSAMMAGGITPVSSDAM